MFKIISYKRLALICSIVCFLLVFSAVMNNVTPVKQVFSENSVKLPIIMYHQISENKSIWGDYVIPQQKLREDFQYMKDNGYNPVSLKTVLDYVNGVTDKLPQNPIVITFDDGERSFLTKVLPLLEEFEFFAVVSIVGALADMYTQSGDTDDRYAYLNWDDIKKLNENPFTELGNHSYNMHSLGIRRGMGKINGETDEKYEKALLEDFTLLENAFIKYTGSKPYIIAYPYGIKNSILTGMAENRGYTVTLTCCEKVNEIKQGQTLWELGRFNRPNKLSTESFFNKITQSR